LLSADRLVLFTCSSLPSPPLFSLPPLPLSLSLFSADNDYFKYLVNFNQSWEVHNGTGGNFQWRINETIAGTPGPVAPGPQAHAGGTATQRIMMLTSDISLLRDPENSYQDIVREFATDQPAFDRMFAHSWYKLTTRDMGPHTRCFGENVPPAQDWQHPLPPAPADSALPDFAAVKTSIRALIDATPSGDQPAIGPLFARLAWQCTVTYRATDHRGGCNGARVRFSPEKDWPSNIASDRAIEALESVKEAFGSPLSWADLIVLAGQTAQEAAGAGTLEFCGGRTDATNGEGSEHLEFTLAALTAANITEDAFAIKEAAKVMGLSNREIVALVGGNRRLSGASDTNGYDAACPLCPSLVPAPPSIANTLDNQYFIEMRNTTIIWEEVENQPNSLKAQGRELYALRTDILIRNDSELETYIQEFADDNAAFLSEFQSAWTRIGAADQFEPIAPAETPVDSGLGPGAIAAVVIGVMVGVGMLAFAGMKFMGSKSATGELAQGSFHNSGRLSKSLIGNDELEADGETIDIKDTRTTPLVTDGPDPATL
jgi:catalase (peroxidase I)